MEPIKTRNISAPVYSSPKTRASEKFLEVIGEKIDKKLGFPDFDNSLKFVEIGESTEQFDQYVHDENALTVDNKEAFDKNEYNAAIVQEKPKSFDFPTFASSFTDKVNIISSELNSEKNIKSIEKNFLKPSEIKILSLKKASSNLINEKNISPDLKSVLLEVLESLFKDGLISANSKPEQVVDNVISTATEENVRQFAKNAELAEEMLNLEFDMTEINSVELKFFEKLKDIIIKLDKGLKEIQKEVEAKNKLSEIKIHIKRFDVKDLKKYTNQKV